MQPHGRPYARLVLLGALAGCGTADSVDRVDDAQLIAAARSVGQRYWVARPIGEQSLAPWISWIAISESPTRLPTPGRAV